MRKHNSLVLLAAAVLLSLAATTVDAQQDRLRGKRRTPRPASPSYQNFALSGELSGPVSGEIVLGGRALRVSPNAGVYEVGRGPVPLGTSYANRIVYVTGFESTTGPIVTSVIVRPARNMALGGTDGSMFIRVRPADIEEGRR